MERDWLPIKHLSTAQYLDILATALDDAARLGNASDAPQGTRYIQISDPLAREIAQELRRRAQQP